MNILFSTTRQWNCGDEFILHGIRRLFSEAGFHYNPIIYNRHPSITPRRITLKHRWSKPELVPHYDNSFILNDNKVIDYVIFAGTPEWYGGRRMDDLHIFIADNNIRCSFIGVGIPKTPVFSEELIHILKNQTDLFVARDPNCYEEVSKLIPTLYLPCPALFSAPRTKQRERFQKIGIVIQDTGTRNHSIPDDMAMKLLQEYQSIEEHFEVTYIAHYIDDLKYATRLKLKTLYSAFSEDYAEIFDQFDFIISTRVHGCGMASSLGIPNMLIPHDGRYSTALKFNSKIYKPDVLLLDQFKELDIILESNALVNHREFSKQQYLSAFHQSLSFLKN